MNNGVDEDESEDGSKSPIPPSVLIGEHQASCFSVKNSQPTHKTCKASDSIIDPDGFGLLRMSVRVLIGNLTCNANC